MALTRFLADCPRFAVVNLDSDADAPNFDQVYKALKEDDQHRANFLKACLLKLGLQVNQEQNAVPSLSRIHLSSATPSDTSRLVKSLQDIVVTEDGEEYIKDENDVFHLEKPSKWSLSSVAEALPDIDKGDTDKADDSEDKIIDYDKIVKRLLIHEQDQPAAKDTPYFNHQAFFSNLQYFESRSARDDQKFGKYLLYGEVVTSTNTLLEK